VGGASTGAFSSRQRLPSIVRVPVFVRESIANLAVVTDLVVLGLPIWIVSKLKIPRRTKFGLLFVFVLGFLCVTTRPQTTSPA
jgi:hypothetical protein